jgi:hypothetical protein
VLGEFGDDPHRYHDARARKNYAGTSPITPASGKKKGHCCFVRSGKSLDSFGGLFDQMARVSSVKAAITRSVVGSSMPSS